MGIKDYIIAGLFTISVALGLWLSYEVRKDKTVINRTVDSTVTVERDTTFPKDTIRVIKTKTPEPDTVYKIKESEKEDRSTDFKLDLTRRYTTTVNDSLIEGKIKTKVRGVLLNQKLRYKPKFPIEIRVDTKTRVTETITKTRKPVGYPHLQTIGYSNLKDRHGILIMPGWTLSNGNSISVGYDPVNRTYGVGVKYNLRNIFK